MGHALTSEQNHWSEKQMLRITENSENCTAVRLRLDGNISVESYADLKEVFQRYDTVPGRTIILDMGGVDFISDEPARQLAKLRGENLRIINCSPFIETLLETLDSRGIGH